MAIVPKKGVLGHFFGVLIVLAGIVAPGTLAADPCSDLAPVRSLRRLTQTPVEYLQSTKLTAVDGASSDHFGYSVSIDGDTIVIGAPYDDGGSGSAYVFTRNRCWNETTGDVSSSYTLVTKLTVVDGADYDLFGNSVSIDGDTIVIGARAEDDDDSGSAYVFTRDTAGDLAFGWTQVTKLTAVDGASGDYFGRSVSIDGDTIVNGAQFDNDDDKGTNSGSAYVFTLDTAGDLAFGWTQVTKLTADDGASDDLFGYSVSIDGDTIVIGALNDDDRFFASGSAYVFTRDTAGDLASGWTQVTKLVADDGAYGDHFGRIVYVDSGMIVIATIYDDDKGTSSGSAYVFTLASESTSIRPCTTCCEIKLESRGFNKACNPELFAVPYCPIVE